jgi:hypothetical protein
LIEHELFLENRYPLFPTMLQAACRPLSPAARCNAGTAVVPVQIRAGIGYPGSEYHSAIMNQTIQPMHG